jgi:superfamily II DNA helicase RecQ
LDQVVIDKCHTVLDSRPDFWPKIKDAGVVIVKRGVQIVYLTATLYPNKEEEFIQIIKVQILSKQVFRAPTSRPNIVYSVVEYKADVEELAAVQELVNQKLEQYPALAKIIIYSSNIDTIDKIGAELSCHIYHASIRSPKTKGRI